MVTEQSLFRGKRGVSEIIASLILILIVAVAGTIVYAYSLSAFNSSGSFFEQQTLLEERRTRERFLIVGVWWNTTNQINLTILNYGKIETTIDAVYINGTAVSTFLSERGFSVGVAQLVWVKFASAIPIQVGNVHEILVVSERGGKNAVYWKA